MDLAGLSDDEYIAYLRRNYPPGVVREFEGILQTARASRDPDPRTSAKSWARQPTPHRRRRPRRLQIALNGSWMTRYLVHGVVVFVSIVFVGKNAPPMIIVGCAAIVMIVGLLVIKDAVSSSVAFTIRSRSAHRSHKINVRVRVPAWDKSAVARILNLVSMTLPPEDRVEYVEDQVANLMHTSSAREWCLYLLGVVLEVPKVAWELYLERRESAK